MKKMFIFAAVAVMALSACTNEEIVIIKDSEYSDIDLLATLNGQYGVSSIDNSFNLQSTALKLKLSNEWDYKETTKFNFNDPAQKVFIVPASNDDIFYIIKGRVLSNNLTIEKEVYARIIMDEVGDGFVEILDKKSNLINFFTLEKGIPISEEEYLVANNQQLKGWCQMEGGESTSGCYKRECDEFCDGFIGCATLATQPQVHLLILAMCSC